MYGSLTHHSIGIQWVPQKFFEYATNTKNNKHPSFCQGRNIPVVEYHIGGHRRWLQANQLNLILHRAGCKPGHQSTFIFANEEWQSLAFHLQSHSITKHNITVAPIAAKTNEPMDSGQMIWHWLGPNTRKNIIYWLKNNLITIWWHVRCMPAS